MASMRGKGGPVILDRFQKWLNGITATIVIGLLLNWFTAVIDPSAFVQLVAGLGSSLASLDQTSKSHQFYAIALVVLVIGLVWLTINEYLGRNHQDQEIGALRKLLDSRNQAFVQLDSQHSVERDSWAQERIRLEEKVKAAGEDVRLISEALREWIDMACDLSTQVNIFSRRTKPHEVRINFQHFCQWVAEFLLERLYGGKMIGKVVFIQFDGVWTCFGEQGRRADDLEANLLRLPIVQSCLATGEPEFINDVGASPERVRTRDNNWMPRNCSSIMVVPIDGPNNQQGVFGVYTNKVGFFTADHKAVPRYLRTLLELTVQQYVALKESFAAD